MRVWKVILLVLAMACLATAPVKAQWFTGQNVIPLGYCQLKTQLASAAAFLTACAGQIPTGATCVLLGVETVTINMRDDGTAPTASTGMPLPPTITPFPYCGNLAALQFIASSSTPALDVLFYRLTGGQ